nr:hypothetical protein Iba_chr06bCG13870 [Ipomoea batatas]GMD95085.1 hypothetical protein Iba_chr15aCG8880 [Ipomoea batatas]
MPAGTRGQLQQVLMPAENGNTDQISAEALLVSPSSISSISQPTPMPQTAATCSRRHPPTLPFPLDLLASATPLLASTTDGLKNFMHEPEYILELKLQISQNQSARLRGEGSRDSDSLNAK